MPSDDSTSPIVPFVKYQDLDAAIFWLTTIAGLRVQSHDANDRIAVLRSGAGITFAQHDPAATSMS